MSLLSYLRLAAAYIKLNWRMQMEYKSAFASQFLAMVLNNSTWLAFWLIFFDRFPVVRGFGQADVVTLWAIASAGFGLSAACCFNLHNLAALIARGQLDTWMLYPRALVPHLALGKLSPTAMGDLAFGYAAYLLLVKPDLEHFLMYVFLTVAVAVLFTGFNLMRGSLAFFLGQAEVLSEQWFFSMITFSTYPSSLFDGWVKLVLFTLIPAGFVAGLPPEALKQLNWNTALLTGLGALAVLGFGSLCFALGLRSYQSGNLMEMRN
ncbi:MAG TPA: ABC-2 family transporter protein [Candidatus Obscuribacter sp.]|nr:ABC-2 family transporter protein [Candidatus Obscuribacter sp.]HMW92310.1 ABC-2 family transporter protein [Candidatus Obscuribacter sp.]HMY02751.1 ABC-2 family transporter protein [Candidatus Obscuribacter sp.]HNB17993.1 ABC-2 family transporter protein [Candidatus Obscuribacter sp.]HND69272.1 ABC-2 family transporter protein [Candidatus Obscuribacter sp.]